MTASKELIRVPTIDVRHRISQQAIEAIVQQIVRRFRPQRIIL